MLFTHSLLRSTLTLSLGVGALVGVWVVNLAITRSTNTSHASNETEARVDWRSGERPAVKSALATHRAALRRLGQKQAAQVRPELPGMVTRLANHP